MAALGSAQPVPAELVRERKIAITLVVLFSKKDQPETKNKKIQTQ